MQLKRLHKMRRGFLEASAIYSGGDVGLRAFSVAMIQADRTLNDGRNFRVISDAFRARNIYGYSEWVQPSGAYNIYKINDRVTFEGWYYISLIDGNIWSPAVYPQGWK